MKKEDVEGVCKLQITPTELMDIGSNTTPTVVIEEIEEQLKGEAEEQFYKIEIKDR
jgi:hypothetical protein